MVKIVISFAATFVVYACSSTPKKVKEAADPVSEESCCCKWTPMISDDAKPKFATENRMECSGKQGDCVDAVQCASETPAQ